jgi:hypothetical protein
MSWHRLCANILWLPVNSYTQINPWHWEKGVVYWYKKICSVVNSKLSTNTIVRWKKKIGAVQNIWTEDIRDDGEDNVQTAARREWWGEGKKQTTYLQASILDRQISYLLQPAPHPCATLVALDRFQPFGSSDRLPTSSTKLISSRVEPAVEIVWPPTRIYASGAGVPCSLKRPIRLLRSLVLVSWK